MDEIRAFIEVVRARGFAAAGRANGVPKSTLSRQVAHLEERLGVQLLSRTTRRLHLTEQGEAFFRRSENAVDAIAAAERAAVSASTLPSGTLRLSCPFDLGGSWLASMLAGFRARYPDIKLIVQLSQARANFVEDGIDIALRGGFLDDSSLIARTILTGFSLILCASPDYLATRGTPQKIEDVKLHDTLSIGLTRLKMAGPHGPVELILEPKLIANEWGFLRRLLLHDLGVGLMLDILVEEDLSAGRLVRVLPQHSAPGGGLYAVFPSRRMPPRVRAFIDYLTARAVNASALIRGRP